ncbi:MAG: DUF4173 domain-containing protein [bacterium]|nr:DUF4173 domain-containing protein [bacterium]
MKQSNSVRVLFVFAIIFAFLFHQQALGLNLVIFEAILFGWFAFSGQLLLKTFYERLVFACTLATLSFTILHHSIWSYVIHFSVLFLYIGVMIAPRMRSLLNVLGMSFSNIFLSYSQLFSGQEEQQVVRQKESKRKFQFKRLRFYIIPVAIIILFATLYGFANPEFGAYVDVVLGELYQGLIYLFKNIDFFWILTFLLGLIVSIFLLMRKKNEVLEERDLAASDDKIRVRNHRKISSMTGLKNEYRVGIFLFGSLNVLLLLMNIMDIDRVWLNFEFEGQFLRQFVHYGTIVLIVAIMLSIVLVLTFFRGNLNFYKKNIWLKRLCYLWLGQNAILAISAAIRNLYYIEYYSLAHKRIAVMFFIILVLYGLFSVFIKIRDTRSNFYMLRKNAVAWLIVLTVSSGFNWDRIIAKYNFSREDGAFVHLNFLSTLSDSALPHLDQPLDKVTAIDQKQVRWFGSFDSSISSRRYRNLYMSPEEYSMMIAYRKAAFKWKWKKKSWLEWNYAEWKANEELGIVNDEL